MEVDDLQCITVTGGVSTQIGGKAMDLRRANADETSLYAHVWKKIDDLLLATRAKQDESGTLVIYGEGRL